MATGFDDKIFFSDSIEACDIAKCAADHIVHILCLDGSMSFEFQNVRYNISRGDYIILNGSRMASDFSKSGDCRCIVMTIDETFVISMALRSNYGFFGRFALLQNPVMKLSEFDFVKCRTDLLRLRERLAEKGHLFHDEMTGHLLLAHILDLYDIHARSRVVPEVPERAANILREFIGMLDRGDYVASRDIGHYAAKLCITPHYLTDICKKVSGEPASYWIDRFTIYELVRLLRRKDMSLAEIAEKLNFSSLSYFSRYVQNLGVSPSAYRSNFLGGSN